MISNKDQEEQDQQDKVCEICNEADRHMDSFTEFLAKETELL
jgi:hypothetical protein